MLIKFDAGAVKLLQLLRRQDFVGLAHAHLLPVQTEDLRGIFPNDMQIVGNQQNGQILFLPKLMQQTVNSFFAADVDSRRRARPGSKHPDYPATTKPSSCVGIVQSIIR
jgi:hypothetical protein